MSKLIALPFLTFVLVLLAAGWADAFAECRRPSGPVVSRPRAVGPFTEVRSRGSIEVRVSRGASHAVRRS